MNSNLIYKRPSYKYFHGSFKKDTNDYHVGKNELKPWDKDSFTEYSIRNFEYILRNNEYTHRIRISKRYLKFFDCSCQSEFEENVLKPILRKLCRKYKQDVENVQKKIVENECISYKEDFN